MELKHPDVEDVRRTKINPAKVTLFFIKSLSSYYRSEFIVDHQSILSIFI